MGDAPFDRVILNNLEKALSKDWNRAQSQLDRSIRFLCKNLFSTFGTAPTGFIRQSLNVTEDNPQAMSVIVKAGLGFTNDLADVVSDIGGVADLDDLESYKPIVLLSDFTFSVPTAPTAPDTRIDIIEVRTNRLAGDNESRKILDSATGTFNPTNVDKTLSFLLDGDTGTVNAPSNSTAALSYKVGVAGNPPTAPTETPGYTSLAFVNVGSGVATITDADIQDIRAQLQTTIKPIDIARPIAITGGPASYDPSVSGLDVDPNEDVAFFIPLNRFDRIEAFRVVVDTTGQGAGDTTAGVYRASAGSPLVAAGNLVGAIASSLGTGLEELVEDLSLDLKNLAGQNDAYYLVVFNNSGSVDVTVHSANFQVALGS